MKRQAGVGMKEQENATRRCIGAEVHLSGAAWRGKKDPRTVMVCQPQSTVETSTIDKNQFQRVHRTNTLKGCCKNRNFVESRNDDGDWFRQAQTRPLEIAVLLRESR